MGRRVRAGEEKVIVFGRYPVPGKVKTRLIPALGPAGAAEIQRRLTENTLTALRPLMDRSGTDAELCMEGTDRKRVRRWLGPGVPYFPQEGRDLGDRMRGAFSRAFLEGYRRVVLVGTDIPGIANRHLAQALDALRHHPLVLGPSTDGGFWLIGLNRPVELFHGIDWGTPRVLDQTLKAARARGLSAYRLGPLTDVDRPSDLEALPPEWRASSPYVSVVIPALNEAPRIEETVRRSLCRDAEVIVADGGSEDGTLGRAERAGAGTLRDTGGRASQQNSGARLARGRVLLFLHADTLLPHGYISQVFDCLLDPSVSLGAFRFTTDLETPPMGVVEALTNLRARILHLPYGDQALFVRRDLFMAGGGFPDAAIAEDLLLVRRLSKRGRVRIAPSPVQTSGRRWKRLGVLRTTLINQIVLAGLLLGFLPGSLAPLYRSPLAAREPWMNPKKNQ